MNSNEMRGSDFIYQIDSSYGLSQDGYIATGTESIVYRIGNIYFVTWVTLYISCVIYNHTRFIVSHDKIILFLEIFKISISMRYSA